MIPRTALLVAATMALTPSGSAYAQGADQSLAELGLADLLAVRAVTGARHDQRVIDSPRPITIVTAEDLRRGNYRSTPEALAAVVGVFMQQTNDGGGAPIIRGLVGNQILLLVDGIRLNNAAYRQGPTQYFNTIDINSIERIEIVRGAGSVLYGSDALGGVINVITKPVLEGDAPAITSRFFTRLASANAGMVGRGELNGRRGSIGFAGGASLKRFGALRGGRETGVQPLTGYDEWDADGKLTYRLPLNQSLMLAGQRVTQSDVLRADSNTTWDPQRRSLAYAQYTARQLRGPVDQLSMTIFFQQQTEEFTVTSAGADTREHLDKTNSLGANVQFTSSAGTRHLLTYGFDTQRDDLTSRREDISRITGERRTERGTTADGAEYGSQALFVQDDIDVSPRLHLNLGTRYSTYHPRATVRDARTDGVTIDSRQRALTGAAHALFRLTSALDIVGGVAQGFRAPNINDLTILGLSGGRYEVPNPGLEPERSVNFEVGIRGRSLRGTGNAAYFVSNISALIERQPGTFEGASFRDYDRNGVRDESEHLVLQRQNTGRARLHGVELDGQLRLGEQWTLAATFVRIIGDNQTTEQPLRRIPPAHGTAKLAWSTGGRVWVEGYSIFASRQARLAPEDLIDPRIPAGGTPGFFTLHARGGLKISEAMAVTLGIENLTNRTYRTHGSGIDMAGTNVVAGIEWIF